MSLLFKAYLSKDLNYIAKVIIKNLQYSIIALYGSIGVGKTTLIKYICLNLGIKKSQINSPTFSIVNEYLSKKKKIYHFDFYRIKNLQEVYDIGYEYYFYSKNICLIEWPEKIKILLPKNYHSIKIFQKGKERSINFL